MASVTTGADLENIETNALSFRSIAAESKLRLTSAWPSLPTPTSSLLSIASRKGLVAAAGPDQLIVATTESIRKTIESPKDGSSDIRAFEPQLRMPMPMRVSQLAFTADESHLILSAESGGGLAVYSVDSLLAASTSPAFELSTDGEALRHMIPNPDPEKAELCALVTNGGKLRMANLKDRAISAVLRDQVSCASWSSKGKQLCAGLADGTIHQMTPEGEPKAEIPKPPGFGECHVSSLSWLENNLFLVIHTTTQESSPASVYNVIQRDPATSSLLFRKITDPVPPFESDRMPHHSILRLRDFPPNLQDVLIVACTSSSEVGLLTRSRTPLDSAKPADAITGLFTTTALADDTSRPTLPMTELMDDSTPIGVALDLSAKDKVYKPIPEDLELEESPGPLPGLWVLTQEGLLCTWWVVYTDSIKAGTLYPGMAVASKGNAATTPAPTAPAFPGPSFRAPTASTFGSSTTASPAFGTSSQLGQRQSPWGTPASTGTGGQSALGGAGAGSSIGPSSQTSPSTFGNPSAIGFGHASQLGIRTSAWAGTGVSNPVFGQSGFSSLAKSSTSPSSSMAVSSSSGPSGFSSFAKQGGFASVSSNADLGASVFARSTKSSENPMGTLGGASTDMDTAFLPKNAQPSGSAFGSTPFKLESSFKPDPSQMESDEQPLAGTSGSLMFNNGFGSTLQDAATTPPVQDEDMDAEEVTEQQTPRASDQAACFSTMVSHEETSTSTFAPATTGSSIPSSPLARIDQPASMSSESPLPGADTEHQVKQEDKQDDLASNDKANKADEARQLALPTTPMKPEAAPLPPDPITLPAHQDSPDKAPLPPEDQGEEEGSPPSGSDLGQDEAPLPPDFLASRIAAHEASTLIPPIPSDSDGGEFYSDSASEGSVVDVAKDLGLDTRPLRSSPPASSSLDPFSGPGSTKQGETQTEKPKSNPLFGGLSFNSPRFSPPNAASPPSPTPLRAASSLQASPFDLKRSVSAPGLPTGSLRARRSQSKLKDMRRSKEPSGPVIDSFLDQQRKKKLAREAEESRALVDEEDDEIQKLLQSDVEGTLELDEFIAHANVAAPAMESVPAQVEALYRDINSMIDTLGLNARSVKAFVRGHMQKRKGTARTKQDLESPDDWVLCESPELEQVLDKDLAYELQDARTQNVDDKLDTCRELLRDMQRLRVKQADLRKMVMARLDSEQTESTRGLPLSAEQMAQQNELRRGLAALTSLLARAEEALVMLKTRLASASSSSQGGSRGAPTVDAVVRTILKMTSKAEQQSGDIDVLESQMHKLQLEQKRQETSPLVTPQARRSLMMIASTPESTPSRSLRQSLVGGMASLSLSSKSPATTPRKKLSGFSTEEKRELMDKRDRRRAMLGKLKESVEKKGVSVWTMDDIE